MLDWFSYSTSMKWITKITVKNEEEKEDLVTWHIYFIVIFILGFLGGSCYSRGCGCFIFYAPEGAAEGHLVFGNVLIKFSAFCLTLLVPCLRRETLCVLNGLLLLAVQTWSCHPGNCEPESVSSLSPLLFQKEQTHKYPLAGIRGNVILFGPWLPHRKIAQLILE